MSIENPFANVKLPPKEPREVSVDRRMGIVLKLLQARYEEVNPFVFENFTDPVFLMLYLKKLEAAMKD